MKLVLPPWVAKFRLALAAAVITVFCLVFLAVRFSRVSDLEDQLRQEQDDVRTIQRNIENGENLESHLERIERITDGLLERTVIPEDASVNNAYFYQFESPQLKLTSVEQRNLGETKFPWSMKNFAVVEFTIVATGSFPDVLSLAYQIRGGPKLVRVTSLSVVPDGASEQRRIDLTIEAVAEKSE